MAFASSSSAFGIKPAAPATTGLFGQSNTPKPQSSLFGSTQPSTTGFGTQTQAQPATQGSSLFGGGFGQSQQQPQQQQQQPASMGLFGQPAGGTQQQQQPQQGGFGSSLFGGSASQNQNTSQPGQQQNTFGGFGSFGSSTTQQQQQPAQSSTFGNWGNNAGATPLQAQPTQPANSSTFGGFGLGSSTTANTGTSLFGGQQKQQSLGLSAPPSSGPPLFTKSTKFNDLPDELKKMFESIDSHIQGRIQISNELKQRKLGEEAIKGQELIRGVHKDIINTTSIIQSDVLFTRDLKTKTDLAVQDTIVATRIIDGFRNPQQSGTYLKNHASFPLGFFNRITEQMKERLQWYKTTIEQIERKLSTATSQAQYTPQAISATLQAQHATFIALASKTAALDAELQKVKTVYTQLWRSKTGSMRDPFNDLDQSNGGDFGLDGLHVR